MDLSNNKFVRLVNTASTSVPENVIDIVPAIVLPYLIRLDVSNNKLSKLPKSMEVPSLQTLSFGNISGRGFVGRCHFAMLKSLSSSEGPNHQLRTVPSLFGCNFIFYDVDECWLSLVKNTMYKHIVRMGKLLIFLER